MSENPKKKKRKEKIEETVLRKKGIAVLHTTEICIDFINMENFGYLRRKYFG